jgi:hypothetical protein
MMLGAAAAIAVVSEVFVGAIEPMVKEVFGSRARLGPLPALNRSLANR